MSRRVGSFISGENGFVFFILEGQSRFGLLLEMQHFVLVENVVLAPREAIPCAGSQIIIAICAEVT